MPWSGPPTVERVSVAVDGERRVSALRWGTGPPEIVLIHGGAQNAHTWDTVALALDRPLLAVDLPGHGHSDWREDHSYWPPHLADDVAVVVRELAPTAELVVGMSLGGLTAICLAAQHPELVRRLAIVDVTPGRRPRQGRADRHLRVRARDLRQLRRDPRPHGRVQPDPVGVLAAPGGPAQREGEPRRQLDLALGPHAGVELPRGRDARLRLPLGRRSTQITAPILFLRGGAAGSVVGDEDQAELVRRQPTAQVEVVADAGHSLQGDQPLELARLLSQFQPS